MACVPLEARGEVASHWLHSMPEEVGPLALNLLRTRCLSMPRAAIEAAFHWMMKSSLGLASILAMGVQSMETTPDLVVVDRFARGELGEGPM